MSGEEQGVVVAGAGPSGLLLAGDLAKAGVPVTVVEKRPEGISNLTRAFGVHARTLEHLDARGLADELVETGQVIHELRVFGSVPFDISGLPSRFPFLLVTPQYEVERLLLRRAERLGVVFRYGTEVTDLAQHERGVRVSVRDSAGTTALDASHLVGADGVRSSVRRMLGLPFPGRSVIRSVVLADVKLTERPRLTVRVQGVGDAFGFLAPFGDGYWRVGGWNRDSGEVDDEAPVRFDELRSTIERAFGTDFGMHEPRWLSRFHSEERQVPHYRVGRVLVVGDAAHTHSPAGGQGMNLGIGDAVNLGWKLAAVLRGRAPDGLLDTYQAERHPVGRKVLRSSGLNLRLAMARGPWELTLRALRKFVVGHVRPVSRRAVAEMTGIGHEYAAPRGSHRAVGKRMRDVDLEGGRLHEHLRALKFVLITPTSQDPGDLGRADRLIVTHWRDDRRDAVLVRPDGHVAWATDHADPAGLARAVSEATGARGAPRE